MASLFQDRVVGGKGGNWVYFAKNLKWIGEYINANQIGAITNIRVEIGKAAAVHTAAVTSTAAAHYLDIEIRGGIRAAHLHFDSKIYLLNEKQWAEVSQKIVADCVAKLAKVKKIEFDDAVALGSMLGV